MARKLGSKDKVKRKSRNILGTVAKVGAGLVGAGLVGGGLSYYLAKRRQKQALNSK
jgi:hypothetical protein